jgi:hypothetical protein
MIYRFCRYSVQSKKLRRRRRRREECCWERRKEVEEIRMVFIRFQGYLNRRKGNTSVFSGNKKESR